MAGIASLLFAYLSPSSLLVTGLPLLVFYTYTVCIHRIYFSPLSHIPGPTLAAASRWYEFYYDVLKVGKYYLEIQKMHERYGALFLFWPNFFLYLTYT